jgi:hypothetical protein
MRLTAESAAANKNGSIRVREYVSRGGLPRGLILFPEVPMPIRISLIAVIALAVVVSAGCTSINYANIAVLDSGKQAERFYVTTGPSPWPARPVGLLEVEHSGVVLFGIFPISPGSLDDVYTEFVAQSLKCEANAAVNVKFETYRPAFPLCIIWWVSWSRISGELVYINNLPEIMPQGKITPNK